MKRRQQSAFTIVELLIVIVVIGILAAITIVAYNGIQERGRASSVSSALSQAAKKITVWQVDYPSTSPTCTQFATELGSSDYDCSFTVGSIDYQYTAGTSGAYCATATTGPTSYYIDTTTATKPTAGGCAGHGQGGVAAVTNIVPNPSVEVNLSNIFNISGSTVTRESNVSATSGAYVVKTVTIGAGANEGVGVNLGVMPFGTYTGSVYAWGSGTVRAWLRFSYTDNTYTEGTYSSPFTFNASPQRLSTSSTFTDNGKTPSYLQLFIRTNSTQAVTFYMDSFMVNTGTLVNYADGNTANWIWNGATDNSTSTGPPL
jgi:general secretion pathway protein G